MYNAASIVLFPKLLFRFDQSKGFLRDLPAAAGLELKINAKS